MEEPGEKIYKDRNFGYAILLLGTVAAVLTMPLFIFLYKYFPRIQFDIGDNTIKLDYIILFLLIFFLTYYLLKKFRMFVVIVVISGLAVMTVMNFANIYTFGDLQKDYYALLRRISGDSFEDDFIM